MVSVITFVFEIARGLAAVTTITCVALRRLDRQGVSVGKVDGGPISVTILRHSINLVPSVWDRFLPYRELTMS